VEASSVIAIGNQEPVWTELARNIFWSLVDRLEDWISMWLRFRFLVSKYSLQRHWVQQVIRKETNNFLGDSNVKQFCVLCSQAIHQGVNIQGAMNHIWGERIIALIISECLNSVHDGSRFKRS
jgi:hypothetical protein